MNSVPRSTHPPIELFRPKAWIRWGLTVSGLGLAVAAGLAAGTEDLRSALAFHASFDHGADADFGAGDRRLFHVSSLTHPRIGKPGLPADGAIHIARGLGKFGDALSFDRSNTNVVFFQAEKNMPYSTSHWGGTVSFWLKLNPDADLAPGFCDPFQITSRQWNDAAMWVDFSKDDKPRHFRFGAFADRAVWDPKNRDLEATPMAERPMVTVVRPPFSQKNWTHVVFTFEGFNTGRGEGTATLYLDGQPTGMVLPRVQTFTWDPSKTIAMLGIAYAGLMDDVAFFRRALARDEVEKLYRLPQGIAGLRQ